MSEKQICPLGREKECKGMKCELWVVETRPEHCLKCEKEVNAGDIMSPEDYRAVMKLHLAKENLESGLAENDAKLKSFGKKSLFHPFRTAKIENTLSEMKRQQAALVIANKRINSLVAKYEKVALMTGSEILRFEGWKKSYLFFQEDNFVWKIGGVKVVKAVKKGCCGLLTENLTAIIANITKKDNYEENIQN